MKISKFVVNPFGENTYILWNGEGSEAAIVDPGMMHEEERTAVDDFVSKNKLSVKMVLLTHVHCDHAASARYLADKYGVKVYAGEADRPLGQALPVQAQMFGIDVKIMPLDIDMTVSGNDVLTLNGGRNKSACNPWAHTGRSVFLFARQWCCACGRYIVLPKHRPYRPARWRLPCHCRQYKKRTLYVAR